MSDTKRILCFGDSNTWGFTPVTGERYPKDVRWTGILSKHPRWEVIEEGLSGRTTVFADVLKPWANGLDHIEPTVLSHEPLDVLVIMLGTNDMKLYVSNCPEASALGVVVLAKKALNVAMYQKFKVLMVAPPIISDDRKKNGPPMRLINDSSLENSHEFSMLYREHAELNGFDFLDAGEFVQPSEKDGVHLTPEGHKALAAAIEAKLEEMLK